MTTEDSAAGTTLLRSRYRLGDLIGTGGLAGVYRAHDEFLGRDVAIKIFRASASAENEFRRQEDEVNLLARLNHPNLVTLLDAAVDRTDPDNPRIYYVMELVDGTDLQQRLGEGTLSARQIAQLGYCVAAGLEQVHHLGIVHRDVKPSNILLANYLDDHARITAKLTDFGIASIGSGPLADNEIVTGTVAYLSPEQAAGKAVTTASDTYSLGLVLLQCFTGELAFPGPPQHATMARLVVDPEIPDSVPAEWAPLLRGMTERNPADRPSIHEVALALQEMFSAEPGRHRLAEPARGRSTGVSDEVFDRITALTARVLGVPFAVLSVTGHDRVWFASHSGDTTPDPRALVDPLSAADLGLKFYAGVPLRDEGGDELGKLCVLDFDTRSLSDDERATLDDLAAMVARELDAQDVGQWEQELLEGLGEGVD